MALIREIEHAYSLLHLAEREGKALKDVISKLEAQRAHCRHIWGPLLKNYEHEGAQCTECGINQLYAISQKIGVY